MLFQISNNPWKRFQRLAMVTLLGVIFTFTVYDVANSQNNSVLENENLYSQIVTAQEKSDIRLVSIEFLNIPIQGALELLAKKVNVGFSYNPEIIPDKRINLRMTNVPPHKVIYKLLEGTNLEPVLPPSMDVIVIREKTSFPDADVFQQTISGTVTDAQSGDVIPGVNVIVEGSSEATGSTIGTTTDMDGFYELEVPEGLNTLVFSYIGYQTQEIDIEGRSEINVELMSAAIVGDELVVVGYGTQERGSITGSISTVSASELEKVKGGATVSSSLAGKVSGLSFRQAEGRPGASANIQIRNMGTPLYVIDGVVKDAGQFNNLSSSDIESISVLKDASAAAIYGSRAANGVVVVETKRGSLNSAPSVNFDSYYGFQRMTRFPNDVLDSGYEYNRARARAEINSYGNTNITQDELDKWQAGTEYGYQSYDWAEIIYRDYAPKYQTNINVSGGSENTNYYFSVTRLDQDAVYDQYNFKRTNLQANLDTRVGAGIKVGLDINGRVESRRRPGIPGFDDYFLPRYSVLRNRPTYGPYANDNPNYLNDIGHTQTNAGLWNYEMSGKWANDWRVVQTNLHAEYDAPIEGLSARAIYSYYYATNLLNNHEFTYDAYTYDPTTDTYNRTGGSTNPWQERGQDLITEDNYQVQLNYVNSFADHNVQATAVTEWYQRNERLTWEHNVPPVNELDIIQYEDMDTFDHSINDEARIGYVGRVNYNYAHKYYAEFAGRYDASWKWPPNERWGFFPSVSVGWRITEEPFFQKLVGDNILTNLKFRASYGVLGDDDVAIGNYAYVPGYNYATGTFISNGSAITTSADRGLPITNVTWFTSEMADIGADFEFLGGTIEGSVDYFYRKRDGLLAARNDVLLPAELGYGIPPENLESDAQMGAEMNLIYNGNTGEVGYSIFGNVNYSRHKTLDRYNPRYGNSWDRYRTAIEDRWSGIFWGYEVTGQFQSQEQINKYDVNIDGEGNTTLLPGDFIYKDVNGDGIINGYDERPIGYNTGAPPSLYGGFGFNANWKGLDLTANFSFGGMYSYNRNWEVRWPFQNNGNLLNSYQDSWKRADVFDPNSEWSSGQYPPLRYNQSGHSNYNKNSTYWLINIRYLRLRTLQVGYSLPIEWTNKLAMQQARIYINTYNLFSIDNLKDKASFLDPEVADDNGLQYPQMKSLNIGVNLTF